MRDDVQEHTIFLYDFDRAREIAEGKMAGHDGETQFRIAADRARTWLAKKEKHLAIQVLKNSHADYAKGVSEQIVPGVI